MALTYTEELVSEYYKHFRDKENNPKYYVSERVPYQYLEEGKKVKGWHDIDVLAVGEDEVVVIETKATTATGKREDFVKNVCDRLAQAEKFVKGRYSDKKITKVFIADWTSDPILQDFRDNGIEAMRLKEIFLDYLRELYRTKGERYGKEENNVTRILMSFVENFEKKLKEAGLLP